MAKAPRQIPKALGVEFNDAIDVSFDVFEEDFLAVHASGEFENMRYGELERLFVQFNQYLKDESVLKGLHTERGGVDHNRDIGMAAFDIRDAFRFQASPDFRTKEEEIAFHKSFKKEFADRFWYVAQYLNDFRFKLSYKALEGIIKDGKLNDTDPLTLREHLCHMRDCLCDVKAQGWDEKFLNRAYSFLMPVVDAISLAEGRAKIISRESPWKIVEGLYNIVSSPKNAAKIDLN